MAAAAVVVVVAAAGDPLANIAAAAEPGAAETFG